jgi:hypothetical protein
MAARLHRDGPMSLLRGLAAIPLPCLLLASGCYTTGAVSASGLRPLAADEHARDILLGDANRREVRVGPLSRIRFRLTDGLVTRWFRAKDLRVADGVLLASGCAARGGKDCARSQALPLETITSAEVNDFSLGQTAEGIVLGTTAAAGAMVVEVSLIALIGAISMGHAKVGSLGITEGALKAVLQNVGSRPPDADLLEPAPAVDSELVESARPLFGRTAIRRDWIQLVATTEIGGNYASSLYPTTSLCATLRFRNIIELGGGVRLDAQPGQQDEHTELRFAPFFRAGLHLELDASGRFAIPAFIDVGSAAGQKNVRLAFGLRVRISDRINLGIYPHNPIWVSTIDGATREPGAAYASTVELGFAL